jgi:hypothetical protein
MPEQLPPAFSWVCPECARRVPTKVAACRCGYTLDGPAEPGELSAARPPAGQVPEPAPPRKPAVPFAAGLTIAAGGLAVFTWMLLRQDDAGRRAGPADNPPTASSARAVPALQPQEPGLLPSLTLTAPGPDSQPTANAADGSPAIATPGDAPVSLALEDVIGRAMPAVVRVETPRGYGSGFFVASDTILTNVHVVTTNAFVTIRRRDNTTIQARVESTAPEFDIAVLRISNPDAGQPVLTLGSGMHARPGQEIIALGTPLGLQNTVTRGIVSAVRDVSGVTLVQTDAAINPGNSGGPLIDRTGQVVGIATMGVHASGAQGLGFGIAIEHARAVMSGERTTTAAPTPVAGLNQAMTGRPAPSDTDAARERTLRAYETDVATIARHADALDARWRTFKGSCYEGRIVGVFDHEWFALWEPKAMQGAVSPGCGALFNDLRRAAHDIHNNVMAINEAARQADIYPGTRRELLRRYRLDYSGWDR